MKKHPIKLFKPNTWSKIIHAAIAANTPSREKIIADGAGEIFFCAYICNVNAIPPDKTPAYIIEADSFNILINEISSKSIANKKSRNQHKQSQQ